MRQETGFTLSDCGGNVIPHSLRSVPSFKPSGEAAQAAAKALQVSSSATASLCASKASTTRRGADLSVARQYHAAKSGGGLPKLHLTGGGGHGRQYRQLPVPTEREPNRTAGGYRLRYAVSGS